MRGGQEGPTLALGPDGREVRRSGHGSGRRRAPECAAAVLRARRGSYGWGLGCGDGELRRVPLFIGDIGRWGESWGGGCGVVSRRAPRAPLMAVGAAAA